MEQFLLISDIHGDKSNGAKLSEWLKTNEKKLFSLSFCSVFPQFFK